MASSPPSQEEPKPSPLDILVQSYSLHTYPLLEIRGVSTDEWRTIVSIKTEVKNPFWERISLRKKDGWQRKATTIFSNHQSKSRRGRDVKVRWIRSKETLLCHKELAGRPQHPSKRPEETSAHCQRAGSHAAGGRESSKHSREKAEKDSAVFQEPIPLASQVKDINLVWFKVVGWSHFFHLQFQEQGVLRLWCLDTR